MTIEAVASVVTLAIAILLLAVQIGRWSGRLEARVPRVKLDADRESGSLREDLDAFKLESRGSRLDLQEGQNELKRGVRECTGKIAALKIRFDEWETR